MRSTVHVGGGRSPLSLGHHMQRAFLALMTTLMFSGCLPSADRLLASFEASARAGTTSEEIVAWGDSIRTNPVGTRIVLTQLPVWARRLPELSSVGVMLDAETGDKIATLTAGGSFGVWGMAIGPREYRSGLGQVRHQWTNGIWFFRQ